MAGVQTLREDWLVRDPSESFLQVAESCRKQLQWFHSNRSRGSVESASSFAARKRADRKHSCVDQRAVEFVVALAVRQPVDERGACHRHDDDKFSVRESVYLPWVKL